ncbi:MAG: hypothetical protein DRP54_02700 [Spirochaetes bacterium]|nr:MAG: hypothetical protein DRP54_02700 [Spirochaetota bacterium]
MKIPKTNFLTRFFSIRDLSIRHFLMSIVILLLSLFLSQCMTQEKVRISVPPDQEENIVMGYGILRRIPGLWHGPVSTTTPAGSFDNWYVDFRPVSEGQVSQYSTLDTRTINYISFFIVKHENRLKVALRTEGVFDNKGCVTYEVIDTVKESEGYYRFSDFQAGDNRAYTEFTFKEDEFLMEVYTNKFNRVSPLQIHARWRAKLGDRTPAVQAISHFNFPQPVMIKDFSNVFKYRSESIHFELENDPYKSLSQPYVGKVTVNISISNELKTKDDDELFLLLTTSSLFEGPVYKKENLKYISRYVFLPVNTRSYTFTNVHPGLYYLYSYNDINGDRRHLRGDYISSNINNTFALPPEGHVTVNTTIDFIIP